jgi:predicted regulator of Ras-like GTPase activity (Roadblock/LC7/MglB family)
VSPDDPRVASAELVRLAGTSGVRLAVAASGDEGLVLHAEGADRAVADAAAALGAAIFARARSVAAACAHGEPGFLRLQCGEGQLLAVAAGSTVLIALANAEANAGRIRLEMLRAAGQLA